MGFVPTIVCYIRQFTLVEFVAFESNLLLTAQYFYILIYLSKMNLLLKSNHPDIKFESFNIKSWVILYLDTVHHYNYLLQSLNKV